MFEARSFLLSFFMIKFKEKEVVRSNRGERKRVVLITKTGQQRRRAKDCEEREREREEMKASPSMVHEHHQPSQL